MKKFMAFYIAFSVIFLVMIYFFTLVQETNKRTLAVFYELGEEARLSEDFESFVKYQSIAHELIEKIDTPSYEFYVYHVIAQLDDQYLNQFTIFVVPIVDVLHATIVTDTQDATGITITTGGTDELIYSTETDAEYDKYAVSFGIKIIGLYFYAVELDESGSIDIVLDDYSGSPIFSKSYDFTLVEYDPENIGNFTLGFTQLEIEEMMDLPSYVQPALIQNITIFIIVDILMGGILNFFLKKKKL